MKKLKMRTKLFFISLFPIAILYFMLYQDYKEPEDISNMPISLIPEFTRLTKPSWKNNSLPLKKNDYYNLIDIDFKFKSLPYTYKNPFLLILVHSAPSNFEKRKAIRETWGRASKKTHLVFLLGSVDKTENKTLTKIRQELDIFDDLVIGSFIDSYKNMTYKHVMGFKYAIYHCKQATYILKTDDDVFVNISDLLRYIISVVSPYGADKLLMCNVWRDASVARSHRSRHRISFEEYPFKTFPNYCAGWFILYSPDVVFNLYSLAQNSEYFWVDDVFITGILAEKSRIPHFNIKNIVITKRKMDAILKGPCDNSGEKFLLGRPNIDSDVVRRLWACSIFNDKVVHA